MSQNERLRGFLSSQVPGDQYFFYCTLLLAGLAPCSHPALIHSSKDAGYTYQQDGEDVREGGRYERWCLVGITSLYTVLTLSDILPSDALDSDGNIIGTKTIVDGVSTTFAGPTSWYRSRWIPAPICSS